MKILSLFILALLLFLPALPLRGDDLPQLSSINTAPSQAVQDQNLSVTCYQGNPNDRNSLGDVMVMNPTAAGPTCNSIFYVCRGNCFGCYSDFDLSQDICVDNSGKRFLW